MVEWWISATVIRLQAVCAFVCMDLLRLNWTEWDWVYICTALCPIIRRRQLQFHFSCCISVCVYIAVCSCTLYISHFLVSAASSPHLPHSPPIYFYYSSRILLFVLLPPDHKTVTPSHHNYYSPRAPVRVNAAASCLHHTHTDPHTTYARASSI